MKSHHRVGRLGVVGLGQEWLFTVNVVVISGFFHFLPTQLPTCVGEQIAPWLWFKEQSLQVDPLRYF